MYHFIVNPSAHTGKSTKVADILKNEINKRGLEAQFSYTTGPKDGTEIARKLCSEGATDIIAVGGDGTIHEILNGIDIEKCNFGIIPCGSGNDFVATAGIPLDPIKALDLIVEGTTKPTDFMVCDGIRGLNIIGTGIDVDILKRCKKSKVLKGKLQYVISLIISLIKFKFYKFGIPNENGEFTDKEALIACIGNGKQFGGGIPMCPLAEIDDGKLDFVVAGKLKKIAIPSAFISLMKGKILEKDFTTCEKVGGVSLKFDNDVTIQIDGELYDGIKFDVSIIQGGLRLYRP